MDFLYTDLGMRLLLGLICIAVYAVVYYLKKKNGSDPELLYKGPMESHPTVILILAAVCLLLGILLGGWTNSWLVTVQMLFDILSSMMVMFCILTLLTPMLRKKFRASTCAALWAVPNISYGAYYYFWRLDRMTDPTAHVIVIRGGWFLGILLLWLTGAVLALAWSVSSHLHFRHQLLREARPADEADSIRWNNMQRRMVPNEARVPLLVSPAAVTPLSIGLMRKTMRVVLPDREYAPEDLELILHHELVHILRGDTQLKLLLTINRAVFWFNPLVWFAMKQSAEDVELAVDEAVLANEPPAARSRYAELVLGSAGDARGFSSCLSARASSLRYRLHAVVEDKQKSAGYWLIGISAMVLVLIFGQIRLAYAPQNGRSVWEEAELCEPSAGNMTHVYYDTAPEHYYSWKMKTDSAGTSDTDWFSENLQKLTEYLLSREYCLVAGSSYAGTDDWKHSLDIFYTEDHVDYWVLLEDHYLTLCYWDDSDPESMYYRKAAEWYLPEETDWDTIDSLFADLPLQTEEEPEDTDDIEMGYY